MGHTKQTKIARKWDKSIRRDRKTTNKETYWRYRRHKRDRPMTNESYEIDKGGKKVEQRYKKR
jgi:hypothetical protein